MPGGAYEDVGDVFHVGGEEIHANVYYRPKSI